MDPLYSAMGWLLSLFYTLVPNLGVSIVLLTATVMLILFPLTAKQTRSMIAMQRVQPEIKKIQQQYKDDRQKQNEELLKFYQEHKINPLSGCLPLIIQMPVFFALFGLLRNPEDHIPTRGTFSELFQRICPGVAPGDCDPQGLYFAGMNLMTSPANSGSVADGFLERLPYFVAVALVMLAGWYQQWQTLRRQRDQARDNPMVKQMQMLSRIFPILFGWFAYIASSGLVLYFLTSSLWRIGQQHLVLNKYYDEAKAEASSKRTSASTEDEAADAIEADTDTDTRADGRTGGARAGSGGGTPRSSPSRGGRPSRHTSRKKRKRRR